MIHQKASTSSCMVNLISVECRSERCTPRVSCRKVLIRWTKRKNKENILKTTNEWPLYLLQSGMNEKMLCIEMSLKAYQGCTVWCLFPLLLHWCMQQCPAHSPSQGKPRKNVPIDQLSEPVMLDLSNSSSCCQHELPSWKVWCVIKSPFISLWVPKSTMTWGQNWTVLSFGTCKSCKTNFFPTRESQIVLKRNVRQLWFRSTPDVGSISVWSNWTQDPMQIVTAAGRLDPECQRSAIRTTLICLHDAGCSPIYIQFYCVSTFNLHCIANLM